MALGAVNSNLFQDDDYRLGSLAHADKRVRDKAIGHHAECVDVMRATGSRDLKLWLPDGTNYPGQDSLTGAAGPAGRLTAAGLRPARPDMRLLIEYKLFEPAFYSMDIPDWGTSLTHCLALGDQASGGARHGHHAPGTNIEFIVTMLLRAGRLGAFDFNSRFYADDDLMVGAADPFQLFRILHEIVEQDAHRPASGVNFMLDQCHNIEPKVHGQVRSVLNVEEALAKACSSTRTRCATAQQAGDVLGANDVLMDAYRTDVREALADRREARGLPRDPVRALVESGYQEQVASARVGGRQASWGA